MHVAFRTILLPLSRPDERMALNGRAPFRDERESPIDSAGEVAGMLLGKGDPAAPDLPALAQQLGYSVGNVAVMVPAPWLRAAAELAGQHLHL